MSLNLHAYLRRIGYTGPIQPTREVLHNLHRAHLLAIPYENLDIHLGRVLSLDIRLIFDKLVRRGRGGWCYEMNGLLAWALREIGFDVTLLSGTVGRERIGQEAEGNHLALLVHLDQPWLADAGFGNGLLEPLPLIEGEHEQSGFIFRLTRTGSRWCFRNHDYGGAGFDFTLEPHTLADFAGRCQWLQTSPNSGFVRVAVCHRRRTDGLITLRGAVLQHVTPDGIKERIIESEAEYHYVLCNTFDLDVEVEAPELWPKVWQSHLAWAGVQQSVT